MVDGWLEICPGLEGEMDSARMGVVGGGRNGLIGDD